MEKHFAALGLTSTATSADVSTAYVQMKFHLEQHRNDVHPEVQAKAEAAVEEAYAALQRR